MKALWKTLNSTRFVIILIILLAVASIGGIVLGECFPTGFYGAEEHYRARYGDGTFGILAGLGVFQPFRSVWFHTLLFLLSASLIACSVSRLRVTVKTALGLNFRRSPAELMSLKHHARIRLETHADPDGVGETLRRRGYAVRRDGAGERPALAASRGGLSRTGPYLTHVGLLFLIVGGMVSGLTGRSETAWLSAGEQWTGLGRDFTVTLRAFTVPQNERGETMQYKSEVEVTDPERGSFTQTISVNHPLRHRGVSFYQSSFRAQPGQLRSATLAVGEAGATVEAPFGERVALPDGRTVAVEEFVADFRLAQGGVISASDELKNPAARVVLYDAGKEADSQWLFLKHPDFRHADSRLGDVRLAGVEPRYATGLQVRTSPGAPLIWAGFAVATLGLVFSFYMSHRKIWVVVEPDALYLAGMTSGNRESFRREFAAIEQAISAAVAGRQAA